MGFSVWKIYSCCTINSYPWVVSAVGSRKRGVCVCVFFELRIAFDSVPHRALLEKLKQLNLNPVLIRWICSYLMRRQKVVVDASHLVPYLFTREYLRDLSWAPSCFLYILLILLILAYLGAPRFLSSLMTWCCLNHQLKCWLHRSPKWYWWFELLGDCQSPYLQLLKM